MWALKVLQVISFQNRWVTCSVIFKGPVPGFDGIVSVAGPMGRYACTSFSTSCAFCILLPNFDFLVLSKILS